MFVYQVCAIGLTLGTLRLLEVLPVISFVATMLSSYHLPRGGPAANGSLLPKEPENRGQTGSCLSTIYFGSFLN
jgi:hypothetical protein